ncbi:MAG: MFS transporter [Actinomycetota bacterium]
MNATPALFPLAGLGAWVAVRWLLARTGRARIAGVLGVAVLLASFGFVWVTGRETAHWAGPENQWVDQPTRTALAAVRAVAGRADPTSPILFVVDYEDVYQAYGWSKTFTNVSRTGLPGDTVLRSMTAFGAVDDVAAGRATVRTDPTYNRMSGVFRDEIARLRQEYPGPPLVFLVRQFNEGSPNADLLDAGDPRLVALGDDVAVVTGPGLATPDEGALEAARAAERSVAAFYAEHPGPLGNPGQTAWVFLALGLLLVLPGALAARFFGLDDPWLRIGLVPGISIALTVVSAIVVVSVHRAPFGVADGWASLGLATAIALGLRVGAARIERVLGAFGRFFDGMFSTFANADFAALMGVQFLVMMADGLVRGSIAKSIAFGGQQGFDITTVPSADYLLQVALALYVPYTFVSPFIGVFIDRFERRRVLGGTALATAAATALVALLVLLPLGGGTTEGNVAATAALVGGMLVMQACVRITLAVKSAALPQVVRGKDLLNGNGLSQAGGALFQVVGAGFAFGLGAALPSWLVVLLGGATLAVGATVARRIAHMETAPHTTSFLAEARRVVGDIGRGFREVAGRPAAAFGLSAFQMLRYQFWGFALMTFALYSRSLVASGSADTVALGIVGGGGFVGGAVGMVLAQRWKDRIPPARLLVGSMAVLGGGTLLFGSITTLGGFAALLFCGFAGFFLGKISADTIVQQAMPDDFRGRAFALFDIAYNLGFIVPALVLVAVWADERVRAILMTSGGVFLVLTVLVWRWSRAIREHLAPQDDLVA